MDVASQPAEGPLAACQQGRRWGHELARASLESGALWGLQGGASSLGVSFRAILLPPRLSLAFTTCQGQISFETTCSSSGIE